MSHLPRVLLPIVGIVGSFVATPATPAHGQSTPASQSAPTPAIEPSALKWINIDDVEFAHPTSLTEFQKQHFVRGLREYLVPYTPDWLERLQNRFIASTWKSIGYFLVKVNATVTVLNTDAESEHVALTLDVNEGPQFRLGSIKFAPNGNASPLSISDGELHRACPLKPSELYDQGAVSNCMLAVRRLYAARGNPNAYAIPIVKINQSPKLIDLVLEIEEGSRPASDSGGAAKSND
jgi:hypothetical protein